VDRMGTFSFLIRYFLVCDYTVHMLQLGWAKRQCLLSILELYVLVSFYAVEKSVDTRYISPSVSSSTFEFFYASVRK